MGVVCILDLILVVVVVVGRVILGFRGGLSLRPPAGVSNSKYR